MNKKKYLIAFNGVFEKGYVKYHLYQKGKTIDFNNEYLTKQWATKFRLKWFAKLCCWILNKSDKNMRTFEIEEI